METFHPIIFFRPDTPRFDGRSGKQVNGWDAPIFANSLSCAQRLMFGSFYNGLQNLLDLC